MQINDKEEKIISKIEEITGIRPKIYREVSADKVENLRNFIDGGLDPREIVFKDENGKEIARVQNLQDFEDALLSLDEKIILKHAKNNDFSKWFKVRGEIELAGKFKSIEKKFEDTKKLRKGLIDILEEYRYSLSQTPVTNFQR